MADTTARPTAAPAADAAEPRARAYVDWPAVLAGAVVATAVAFLFTTFGTGIGLSLTDLVDGENAAVVAVVAVALWTLWVAVSSFMAGGYVTGRLRRPAPSATAHEVEMRDGMHGVVMWGVGALLGAVMASMAIAGAARVGAAAASSAGSAVTEAVTSIGAAAAGSASEEQISYLVDQLFRVDGEPGTVRSSTRDEVGRMIGEAGTAGEMPMADQDYLTQTIAARSGVDEAEARARVDQLTADLQAAADAAAEAADTARRIAVIGTFLAAASLLIGAVAAWWAAGVGGRHRDEGTDFSRHFGWRR